MLCDGDQVTVTVAVPEPGFRSAALATTASGVPTLPGGLNAVVRAGDAADEPFAFWAKTLYEQLFVAGHSTIAVRGNVPSVDAPLTNGPPSLLTW